MQELVGRSRLVTLTGVGGCGKTRLALEAASRLQVEFRDGVVLVELAPVDDPAVIAQAVTHALGLADVTSRSPQDALFSALDETDLLLLLDNCEHLVADCARLVVALLRSLPMLRVLATSREPLDVRGEVTLAVPPLSLPSSVPVDTAEGLLEFSAIRLFAERAADARPGFDVSDAEASTVAGICERLDGLPLAIELAAARMRSMSAGDILERLDDRFELLKRTSRPGVSRHHTLRSTIDWSYDLLSDPERVLFARLSIFAGGWSLADAEAVCANEPLDPVVIAGLHTALVERSLVVAELGHAVSTRYRLLETLRAYAAERMAEGEQLEGLRRRHFERFLAIAEAYYDARIAGGSDAGLPSLAAQRDNFRASLSWATSRDPDGALRMTAALEDFWRMISAAEGWRWLQQTLAAAPSDSPYRLRALLSAGMLSAYIPAYAEGAGLLREVVDRARQVGDGTAEAWAELWLGRIAFFGGDANTAQTRLERASRGHEQLGNTIGLVRALSLLGLLQALILGRTTEGEERLERAAALASAEGDSFGEGYAHMMLALCAAEREDLEAAASHSRLALGASALGPLLGIPLQVMGRVAQEHDSARALRLLGAASMHLQRTGTVAPPFLQERSHATRIRAEQLVGPDAASRLWCEGRRLSLAEAITEATADDSRSSPEGPGVLTPREAQVVALVARGRTNREVAAALHISRRTAESHLDHILSKLGLRNRTELAAWSRANTADRGR